MEELWQEVSDELSRLTDRVERLSSLIEVGAIISSSLDLDEVLRLVMTKARTVMESETCSILLLDEETEELTFALTLGNDDESEALLGAIRLKMGQGVAGWCAQNRQSVVVNDVASDNRFFSGADKKTGFTTRSLIAVPLLHQDRLIGVAEVINPLLKDAFDESDKELFETFCRQVAIAIDNARFHQAFLQQQRLREQLEVASTIQDSFLPDEKSGQADEGYILEATSNPAQTVGGDLYDHFLLPGHRLALMIGDVSGKGVAASLYMAKVVSEFRYLARLLPDPAEVVSRLNRSLCDSSRLGMFVTGVYWIVDLRHGTVSFCNAGHMPSLLRRADGKVELIEGQASPPMGISPDIGYQTSRLNLESGDSLLMLTDGVIEAWDENREQFGYERLLELAGQVPPGQPMVAQVVKAVDDWEGEQSAHDDVTLLEMIYTGQGEAEAEDDGRTECALPEHDRLNQDIEIDVGLTPRMLAVVRDVTGRMATLAGFDDDNVMALKLAVDEACTNVLRHAYCGDTSRRLQISYVLEPTQLSFMIHDFGVGFDPDEVRPLDPGEIKPGGMGLHLIRSVMDEVEYLKTDLEGNTLRLVKNRPTKG